MSQVEGDECYEFDGRLESLITEVGADIDVLSLDVLLVMVV